MTDDEIKIVLAPMVIHVGKSMTNEQIAYWHRMLNDLSFESAKRGVLLTLRDYQYAGFPPVGLVRKNAGASSGTVTVADRMAIAWGSVKAAVRIHGGYVSVTFDDPITNAAIRQMGGWISLCDTEPDKFDAWLRKDFERAYQSLMAVGIREDQSGPLIGICDQTNEVSPNESRSLRRIETNLPPIDKKLIRQVIQEPKRLVAKEGDDRDRQIAAAIQSLPDSVCDSEESRDSTVSRLERAEKDRQRRMLAQLNRGDGNG